MSETGDVAGRRPCVAALVDRTEDLRRALRDRSLLVRVAYQDGPDLRLMFTRSGILAVQPSDEPFEAQVEIRGTAEDIRSFLLQRQSVGDAILAGVLTLRIPEDEAAAYGELRALVAEVVRQAR